MPQRVRSRGQAALHLCHAIGQAHPQDAAQIMAAALRDAETFGPQHDPFGHVRQDARYWAELAPPHEVQAYVLAGLRQLGQQALGSQARKEIFAALWKDMPAKDKAAFLAAIQGGRA